MGEEWRNGGRIVWSPVYRAAWDETPEEYVARGIVGWGRSRRLARFEDAALGFKAYLGVQHDDPARWHGEGAAVAKFFLSVFKGRRTLTLRTFPTLEPALAALDTFHAQFQDLAAGGDERDGQDG